MKKYQIQTTPTKSYYKQIYSQKQQSFPHSQSTIINTFITLIRNLSNSSKNTIQTYVHLKASQFKAYYNMDFNSFISSYQLKYILFNLIELQQTNNGALDEIYKKKLYENINPLQSSTMDNTCKRKKTSIYIDLDFTQFLQKTQQQLNSKQKIIQKLQDVMIDKDNQIDILQDQNQELKKQIQEIFQQTNNQNTRIKNQKINNEEKIIKIQDQNKILHHEIGLLNNQIKTLEKQNDQQPEEFFRRCLLLQALSIEHFIQSSK